jgi:hypothetical protein
VLQVVLPRAARLLGMLEPALERVVYQDIPANLLALKHRCETRRAAQRVAELESQGDRTLGRLACGLPTPLWSMWPADPAAATSTCAAVCYWCTSCVGEVLNSVSPGQGYGHRKSTHLMPHLSKCCRRAHAGGVLAAAGGAAAAGRAQGGPGAAVRRAAGLLRRPGLLPLARGAAGGDQVGLRCCCGARLLAGQQSASAS